MFLNAQITLTLGFAIVNLNYFILLETQSKKLLVNIVIK